MFTNKKKEPDLIGFLILIAIWMLLILMFILKDCYITAICLIYSMIIVTIKRLFPAMGIQLTSPVKWVLLLIGVGLLLLQIGFKDYYPYSQVGCAAIVLIGLWNLLR